MLVPFICPQFTQLCRFGAGTKAAPPPPMVDGCGNLQFFETKGDDKFTVKLATKPRKSRCMRIHARVDAIKYGFSFAHLPCTRIRLSFADVTIFAELSFREQVR